MDTSSGAPVLRAQNARAETLPSAGTAGAQTVRSLAAKLGCTASLLGDGVPWEAKACDEYAARHAERFSTTFPDAQIAAAVRMLMRDDLDHEMVVCAARDSICALLAEKAELLAALKALLPEGWGDDDTMDHMPGVKLARAAIAKAEGLS